MSTADKIDLFIVTVARFAFVLGGAALVLYGIALLGYQVVFWLQWQQWQGCTVLDLMIPVYAVDGPIMWMPTSPTASGWLANPGGWYGLHTVVTVIAGHIPFGLVSIVVGALLFNFGGSMQTVAKSNSTPL